MPRVSLIDYTGAGHQDPYYAAKLLAFTKSTRLNLTPDGFKKFLEKPFDQIYDELDYMATTIRSSWEFVSLTFSIQGLSRACAQQVTRTRNASYAMQSQRVTNMANAGYVVPDCLTQEQEQFLIGSVGSAIRNYVKMIEMGAAMEDARALLPNCMESNLIAKYNFRSWVELVKSRSSDRVQGEYRMIINQMKSEVARVWPWSVRFLVPDSEDAIKIIENAVAQLKNRTSKNLTDQEIKGLWWSLAKAADLLRK